MRRRRLRWEPDENQELAEGSHAGLSPSQREKVQYAVLPNEHP